MQRRTAEDFLPEQWTEQMMNRATWDNLPDVARSTQPRQRSQNTRNVAHPAPSNPSPTFSPYATTNQLGKRGRDNTNSAASDDVVVVPDEGSAQEPRTKRQRRMQRVEKEGGKIGKDNRKENKVRFANGSLECLLNYEWVPAAYHNDRRHALLLREDRKGRYAFPMEHGLDPDDRMAFHPDYANIDMRNRESRPDILYQWEPTRWAAAPKPGYMIDEADGRYLIDIGGHPIRDCEYPYSIPTSLTPAVWMEYWRRINQSITLADIVARCPKKTQKHSQTRVQELTLQAFGNRMRRTRVMLGTKAWEAREGTREVKARLLDLMPNRVRAELDRNGTTKSWRDLITAEIDAIFHVNKGKGNAIARAGDKRLSEPERRARDGKKQAEVAATLQRLQDEKRADDATYDSMRLATEGSDIPDTEVRDQMHENRDSEALVRSRANQSEEYLGSPKGRNADNPFTNMPRDERSTRAAAGDGNNESTSDDSLFEEDTTVVEQQADYVTLYEQQFRIEMERDRHPKASLTM
ncbi:MAG: hypothetical protein L6R35_007196 [Caloplaca aegaea]|nr:MAG: hypothetical protein L6R35_007196 [Caloplaca aegaea]